MTKVAKRILAGVMAFVCVAAASVGIVTKGYREWGPTKEVAQEDTYKGMVAAQTEARNMSLRIKRASSAAAQASDTVTVSATLATNGNTVYNKVLNWSIAFKNANSTWASGKKLSDYVTMTVAEDTQSITLTCLKAFSEPITVTAVSDENSSATASCQLDYVKRFVEKDTYFDKDEGNAVGGALCLGEEFFTVYDLSVGEGTITPSIEIADISLIDTEEFFDITNQMLLQGANLITSYSFDMIHDGVVSGLNFEFDFAKLYGFSSSEGHTDAMNEFYYEAKNIYDRYETYFKLSIETQAVYKGVVYDSFSESALVRIDLGSFPDLKAVTGVNLNQSQVIF